MTRRRGRRRRKLLDDLKEGREYSHLKEKALDRTMWRARFGRGFGPVVRQTTKGMNMFFSQMVYFMVTFIFEIILSFSCIVSSLGGSTLCVQYNASKE